MGLFLVAKKGITHVNLRVTRLPLDLYLHLDEPVFTFNCMRSHGAVLRSENVIIMRRHKEQNVKEIKISFVAVAIHSAASFTSPASAVTDNVIIIISS